MITRTTWTIGGLSREADCKIETIRYYEHIGLLPDPPRTAGGHRIYALEQVKRLTFIRRCRELGFTVDEIRELLTLVDGGHYTCEEVREVVVRHLKEVRQRLKSLRAMEKALGKVAGVCSGGTVPECPFIDTLYAQR
ncbi:MAG: transcriptional regulator [Gammaproteobacteria bacterium]|nr:MAG: transcriptional regulator [Gammaproteobacteria bacterium]